MQGLLLVRVNKEWLVERKQKRVDSNHVIDEICKVLVRNHVVQEFSERVINSENVERFATLDFSFFIDSLLICKFALIIIILILRYRQWRRWPG